MMRERSGYLRASFRFTHKQALSVAFRLAERFDEVLFAEPSVIGVPTFNHLVQELTHTLSVNQVYVYVHVHVVVRIDRTTIELDNKGLTALVKSNGLDVT